MNLIMITPRVRTSEPILAFIPTWVTHLARRVDRLWVVTPRAEAVPLPGNVTVYQVGRDYSKGETVFHALRNFHRVMWRLTRDEQVDGIFTHMYPKFAVLAAPYAKLKRIPLVMWYTHTHVSWQLKLAHLLVDRIVTASPGSCRLQSSKVTVLGHGIDTGHFCPPLTREKAAGEPWRLLSVGRISPSKHYEVILEALGILACHSEHTSIRFLVVGDAPDKAQERYVEQLHQQVEKRQLQSVVTFVGRVPHREVVRYYQQADIFVSASETGLDKAVLEAMACGVIPVLSLEEFRPIFGAFADTLMYKPGDAGMLAERLQNLLTLEEPFRRELTQTIRVIVLNAHNIDSLMKKLIQVFEDIGRQM